MFHRSLRGLLFVCLLLPLIAAAVDPQPSASPQLPTESADLGVDAVPVVAPTLNEQLKLLLESIERKQRQLEQQRASRGKESNPELEAEIERTKQELEEFRVQFAELATNDFNTARYSEEPQFDINWQEDLIQVIYPLLRELKQLTEKPRTVERINAELAFYRQHVEDMRQGLAHLDAVIESTQDRKLLRSLRTLRERAGERYQDLEQKVASLELRLQDRLEDESPLWPSIGSAARTFATGLGLHLMLAFTLSIAAFYLVQLAARVPRRLIAQRHVDQLVFVERIIHFLARAIGVAIAVIVFLMVLYSLGAWVLMGLSVIVLLGLVFSLKGTVADNLVEIRTLFNLGSVRQGERLIYNGLPWRIASLDVYTTLHNPALGGLLRVPLTKISGLSSRPSHQDEPWFPTSTGDVVMLSDGLLGSVALQTPEIVQLNVGESLVTIPTADFLEKRPQNLSVKGFSVGTDFGIDYRHQATVTTEILETYRAELENALRDQPFAQYNLGLSVEFKAASASSLDFRVGATFTSGAAGSYGSIQRWLQKASVECANKHGWDIPFQQIVVHHAGNAPTAPDATIPPSDRVMQVQTR